jgi:hypothetical protein
VHVYRRTESPKQGFSAGYYDWEVDCLTYGTGNRINILCVLFFIWALMVTLFKVLFRLIEFSFLNVMVWWTSSVVFQLLVILDDFCLVILC